MDYIQHGISDVFNILNMVEHPAMWEYIVWAHGTV